MKYWASESCASTLNEVGGKGLHLQKLVGWGARVSPFFVITTECYEHFMERGKLPKELEEKFEDFFKKHPVIALRSSMIGEDNLDSSFAGLFETLLDVNSENWKESLLRIYDSVNSPRAREYLDRKSLKQELLMAVVAQALVKVNKSGVLFTRSPVAPTAAFVIDAAFGMGEGVVSGHSLVDHYQLTRSGDLILHVKANELPVLSNEELKELLALGLALEARAGLPSDIEWGYKDGSLYVFQIRPITRGFDPISYFVDTNLSESYPGTVSPFTAKFVQRAYHNVFRESAVIMGAKGERLALLDFHYARLIGHVDNHLYYNLEHYYAALKALPGGEKNIENWHKMIGGKLSGFEVPRHPTELSFIETAQTIFSLIHLGLFHKKIFGPFLTKLDAAQKEISREQEGLKKSGETIVYLSRLIERPLGFGLTVVNDIFIMMGVGYLARSFKKRGIREERVIDLLKTSEGVDSMKPLELFNELVSGLSDEFIERFAAIAENPGLGPYKGTFEALESENFGAEVKMVAEFLSKYGDRSFEELKLESLPLKNNPPLFVQLLKWAKANPGSINKALSPQLQLELGWAGKKIVNFTRQCIAMREATRLWRGKFYHLLRMLVLKLGEQLQEEDSRWKEFSVLDFFSLNHLEWVAHKEGRLSFEEVRRIIIERRPWQSKRQQYPEMIQWVESERLPGLEMMESFGELSGQGVSLGTTEAVALVLENPSEALRSELKNFILVTKNTDPAWVYIMSRSQGLISEKGSLLSHTAIIGRELAIPTIVGVRGATVKIKTGDRLRIDGGTGKIEVIWACSSPIER